MSSTADPYWPAPMSDERILLATERASLDRAEAEECLSWVRFEQWRGRRFTLSDVAVNLWLQEREQPMPARMPWEPQ